MLRFTIYVFIYKEKRKAKSVNWMSWANRGLFGWL